MKKLIGLALLVLVLAVALMPAQAQAATDQGDACWGQASAVFAQTGKMGEHASQQPTPRLGLKNLAKALAEAGIIENDSMAALGAFVADAFGWSIDACM